MTVTADLQNRHEGFVEIDGKAFYVIPDVDQLAPFLMNVVSSSDLWMFVTSRGGLTAGRGDATKALFPYETEDRLFRSHGTSGPATVIRTGGVVWEPFAGRPRPETVRNLYKSVVGDEVIFEEINAELDLTFSGRWSTSEQFGFVRTSRLANLGNQPVAVDVVDGLLDILPAGLEPSVYYEMGNLVNAYKRSELIDPSSRLAAYTLESQVLDRAEPAESLRATTVWAVGSETATVTLDPDAVNSFALGSPVKPIELLTGRPGAYLVVDSMVVSPAEACDWSIVADVARSQAQVAETRAFLRDSAERSAEVRRSVDHGTASLAAMMAGADGSQLTGDRMTAAHHLANVLYNAMRGGVFADAYDIDTRDYRAFLEARNRRVAVRHAGALDRLEQRMARRELLEMAADSADPHLIRLTLEYLPLSFSRRHGDPSRPWNKFSIRLRDRTGAPLRYYEGNWRDIFQNWEALCLSYPDYLPGVIATFVNASTVDGFNAYRLTRDGIDWEVPEPDRPWGNIGYWGDHQIVYLLRLLEAAQRFEPGEMTALLGWEGFSYADVPYRIAPYERIKQDPERTIEFDEEAAALTALRVEEYGSDGRLLPGDNGDVYLVTLLEKLVVPALSKLSNFVPGGGIWIR